MVKLTIDHALKKAVEAHNAGAIHDADRIYTTILKVQPKHPVANHNMGLLAVSMNKLEVALPFFKTALEVQPKITNFWLSYISALIALKRFNDAKLIFGQAKEQGLKGDDFDRLERRLSEISYESTEVFLKPTGQTGNILDTLKLDQAINLAQKKAKNGSPEEAQLIYKNILAKFPNNTKAKRGIALLKRHDAQEPKVQEPPQDQLQLLFGLFNQGQLEQALRKSTELLGRFPSSIILHNIRGAIHAGLTQYDMAISFYERALVLNPNNAEVCCNMGHAFRAKGDLGSAMSNYQKTLKLDPKYIEAYASIANIFKHRGELSAAIKNYKLALKINPNQAEICFNLGNALQDNYDLDAAIDAYNQALKIKPNFAVVHYNMGMAFMEKGALEAALDSYKKAIKINPDYAEAYNNMGMALKDQGDLEAAIDSYKVAIRIKPDYVQAHNNVGIAFFDRGDLDNALDSYKHAIKINPDYAEAYNNMGIAFFDRGAFDDALDSYKCAIKINPDYAEAYNNMGTALKDTGDLGAAIDCYKQALKIRPELAEAHNGMARGQSAKCDFDDAIDSYKRAIKIKPDYAEAYNNMGSTLTRKGDFGGAIDSYKRALDIKPDFAEAHYNLGLELLRDHNFEQGFELLEHRWKIKQDIGMELVTSKPLWGGERDQIVFVWAEQGIGDEIMFFSLIPELYSASSKLIVQCDQRLIPLFQRSFPKDIIYESRRSAVTEDLYDFHTPIGSLARIFRTSLESFRKTSDGYLRHDGVKTTQLRQKLLSGEAETLIGVNWKTASPLLHACERNIALHEIAEVLNSPKVQLVCLQYGDVSDEIDFLKEEFGINVLQVSEIDNRNDIDDLASLIMACDKIVSTTNATVHLAGSLGADVRVLLPFSARWIWGTHKSPRTWYNSITQYRQHLAGDWSGALQILSKDIKNENLEK